MNSDPNSRRAVAAAPLQASTLDKQQQLENLLRVLLAEFISLSPEERAKYEQPAPIFERTLISNCSQAVH